MIANSTVRSQHKLFVWDSETLNQLQARNFVKHVNIPDESLLIVSHLFLKKISLCQQVDLGGLVVSVLATESKVRWFKPSRGRWIFKGDRSP
jgi:hypothetical protein